MKDVIRKYLCNSCLRKEKNCMKYTEKEEDGIKKYKCEGYIYNNISISFKEFDYKIRSNK